MIVISTGIMMSTADSTQKKVDMLMSDRTVLKRKSTDHSETRIEEEGRERIKKGMKTEVRSQWSEVGRATEAGLPLDGSSFTEEKLFVPERGSVLHALSMDWTYLASPASLILTNSERPRTALHSAQSLSCFQLGTENLQLIF